MCLRRAPEIYITGAALDRAVLESRFTDGGEVTALCVGGLPFSSRKIPGNSFLLEAESTLGP
jgi:hypothetical protein